MAPSVVDSITHTTENLSFSSKKATSTAQTKPLVSKGSLDTLGKFDVTPVIGTEFPKDIKIVDLLNAPNSDDLIRDLAILISQRGVVFFRDQDITIEQQKQLGDRLGRLSGKPESSGLHIHPTTWEGSELGDEISVIDADKARSYYKYTRDRSQFASTGWHADITFERVPSDYAILKLKKIPKVGGDTLWASGYEVYDRLTPAYKKFLEGLTATHSGERFQAVADRIGEKIRIQRGSPENGTSETDRGLVNTHPVVRTNPVTGWKSVYVNRA